MAGRVPEHVVKRHGLIENHAKLRRFGDHQRSVVDHLAPVGLQSDVAARGKEIQHPAGENSANLLRVVPQHQIAFAERGRGYGPGSDADPGSVG